MKYKYAYTYATNLRSAWEKPGRVDRCSFRNFRPENHVPAQALNDHHDNDLTVMNDWLNKVAQYR